MPRIQNQLRLSEPAYVTTCLDMDNRYFMQTPSGACRKRCRPALNLLHSTTKHQGNSDVLDVTYKDWRNVLVTIALGSKLIMTQAYEDLN